MKLYRHKAFIPLISTCFCVINFLFIACKHKPPIKPDSGYPPEIENIIVNRCAISGCHNQASYSACDSLLLDTWDHMFQGDNSGAVVVAYKPEYSPLLYYLNTDSSLGPILQPLMPYQAKTPILSKAEYQLLVDWINRGAPDKNGNIPFASDAATRQKIYITMVKGTTGVDLMGVIDAKSGLIMRYLEIGLYPNFPELPHCVKCSSDGSNAYVVFTRSGGIQKINTETDQLVASFDANSISGSNNWSGAGLCIDSANTMLAATNYQDNNSGGAITAATPAISWQHFLYGGMTFPHAIAATRNFDTFFVTAQGGNIVYLLSDPGVASISIVLNGGQPTNQSVPHKTPDPHDIIMLPDYSKFVVSCQNTYDVRLVDTHTWKVDSIHVGFYPQELALSLNPASPYLFVSCQDDSNAATLPKYVGSVYVINYKTLSVVKVLNGNFSEPHGLAVDDRDGLLYVFSSNASSRIHVHGGTNSNAGWYNIYDLKTLTPLNTKTYTTQSNTYSAAVRFVSTR